MSDRLVVFWSDMRCPHEVLPTSVRSSAAPEPPNKVVDSQSHILIVIALYLQSKRYAVTIWYDDVQERALAFL